MELEAIILAHVRRDYTDEGFEQIFARLDTLHDIVSAGRLTDVTDLPVKQVRGWLEEFIFTARETLREMDNTEEESVHSAGMRG